MRIVWNLKAFKQIRHLLGSHVERRAHAFARALPPGYEVVVQRDPSTQRPRAYIVARTMAARRDDAENNTMLRLLSTMRGG